MRWIAPGGADTVCDRARLAGFNVLIPCVWHGRGTSWPTLLAPWDSQMGWVREKWPHFDPLLELTRTAPRYGLEVHPWFTLGLRQEMQLLSQFARSPYDESFDFFVGEFRSFLVALVSDVARRYAIQGVNLDFARFDGPQVGREAAARVAVGDVIRRIHAAVKGIDPRLVVSVDAAPWHSTIRDFGQDSIAWADEGIVDIVYSMQYEPAPDFDFIERTRRKMRRPDALLPLLGNFDTASDGRVSSRDPSRLASLIERSRASPSANGIAVYYYGGLDAAQIRVLRQTVFAVNAHPRWRLADGAVAVTRDPSAPGC
jgi:uncharacterized lipoprotein YddW (UPF0748 family)